MCKTINDVPSLYVHIPFCHSKCIYCDFFSVVGSRDIERVVDGIIDEFKRRWPETGGDFSTVYFGGGTPSSLPVPMQVRLFEALPLSRADEVTIEANPEDVTLELAYMWQSAGINRVSLGVQTFHTPVLRRLGRRHSGEKVVQAIECLNRAGIANISVDLIYGLPGIDEDMWHADLHKSFSLPITHLSAYSLTFSEGTMLWKMMISGKVVPISDDVAARRFDMLREHASAYGYEHYEISNFALSGFRSRHNSGYWIPGHRWLGLGPSAHSFDGRIRRIDKSSIKEWLESLPCPYSEENETELDIINDYIVSALRTADGLPLEFFEPRYARRIENSASRFLDSGAMTLIDGRLAISPSEWLRSDYFIRELILLQKISLSQKK